MLKLITPPLKTSAKTVEDPKEIIREALEIQSMIIDGTVIYPGSKHNDCFAVAQPQVSTYPLRYFVINPRFKDLEKIFGGVIVVNPKVLTKNKLSKISSKEGCLSWPFRFLKSIKRYEEIEVSYVIIDNKGRIENIAQKSLKGLPAIIFQHELDHLNGRTIWDKK